MSGVETASHSVIVDVDEAFGYLDAAALVPDVRVQPVIPETAAQARMLISEHIAHLVAQHRRSLDEGGIEHLIGVSREDLEGAFHNEGVVFVRILTPRDASMYSRLDTLALLAMEHATSIWIPDELGPDD